MEGTKNGVITIARVGGMFCIILCHLFTWLKIPNLTELFNVGVPLFLFISGYLFGGKPIENRRKWLMKRFARILIPFYVFITALFLYCYFARHYDWFTFTGILRYVFNIQGISFVLNKVSFQGYMGVEHLWFLTVIILCYLLTLAVKEIEKRFIIPKNAIIPIAVIAVVLQCILSMVDIQTNYFTIYFVGYFVSRNMKNPIDGKRYTYVIAAMIVAVALRLILRSRWDVSEFYIGIAVPITQDILAIWIFFSVVFLNNIAPKFTNVVASSKPMLWADRISYYVYITHYMFLVGPCNVRDYTDNTALGILLFITLSFASAFALYFISDLITKINFEKKSELK